MIVYIWKLWKCDVPVWLKKQKYRQLNNLSKPALFTFIIVICSVLNEAGKLTSIFGFQQARYDEREADCRPGRQNWLNRSGQMLQGDRQMGAGCGFFPALIA